MDAPRRILVRLPNWLGDVLMARPALAALRAAHPAAELRAVGPAGPGALLAAELPPAGFEPWPADGAARARLAHALRAWRPDLAVVMPPSFSSAWFAWRTGARARVGYRGEARSPLLTRALARPARGESHLAQEYLALAAAAGADPALRVPPPLAPPADGVAAAAGLLATTPAAGLGYALLGPGAVYGPAKRWAPERLAEAGRALAARGLAVLAVGTPAERAACEAVAAAVGEGAASLAGRTDLGTLAAVAAGAAVAVCNDSGLAHLCAAVGTPTVAVFGSTSSAWTAPLGARVRVVQRAPVCSPCFRRTCAIGYVCLAAVTVRDVTRACAELLGEARAA